MKKLLFALAAAVAPLLAAYGVDIEGISYTLREDGTAQVSTQGAWLSGEIEIPEVVTYEGTTYSVTRIADSAFRKTQIESIKLPNGITTLPFACFSGCSNLTTVDLPESLTTMGRYCFENCTVLTSINLPGGITTIGECCFIRCSSLTSITLPDGITSLEPNCFQSCTVLTSVTLPSSLTTIGEYCFSDCYKLNSIDLPNGLTSIGPYGFNACRSLASIDLPNTITSMGDNCFANCDNLRSVSCHWANLDGISVPENAFADISSEACLYVPAGQKRYTSQLRRGAALAASKSGEASLSPSIT